jgi:hypothetical protein
VEEPEHATSSLLTSKDVPEGLVSKLIGGEDGDRQQGQGKHSNAKSTKEKSRINLELTSYSPQNTVEG